MKKLLSLTLLAVYTQVFVSGCSKTEAPSPTVSKPETPPMVPAEVFVPPSAGATPDHPIPASLLKGLAQNELLYNITTNKSGFRSAKSRQKWLSLIAEIENEVEPPEFSSTPSGLKYRFLQTTSGKKLTSDQDHPLLSYVITLEDGRDVEIIHYGSSSKRTNTIRPIKSTPAVQSYPPGIKEGLKLMKEGEVLEMEIKSDLGYGNQKHDNIPPNANLHVVLKLLAVNYVDQRELLSALEKEGYTKSDSGLLYKILKPSSDRKSSFGDRLTFHCKLDVMGGKGVMNTYETQTPLVGVLTSFIPGISEGLRLIGQGGEVELIIPPRLGYYIDNVGFEGTVPKSFPLKARLTLLNVETNPNLKWRQENNQKPGTETKNPA